MTNLNVEWCYRPVKPIDNVSIERAVERQKQLTKPPGSLGELETLAIKFCGWQGSCRPVLDHVAVRIFAADHGICAQGVSAFPQSVTCEMVRNFSEGGAAISVLCRELKADFAVVNMGTACTLQDAEALLDFSMGPGTEDFSQAPAMSVEQCRAAMAVGRELVADLNADIFIGGEMGIANTTSAAAMYCALLGLEAQEAVGPGTGLSAQGVENKAHVVAKALSLHKEYFDSPLEILRRVGGFEIAALTSAYIACAQLGIPVVVDGFICTAAALCAQRINSGVGDWLIFSHCSAEPSHTLALQYFEAKPLLDLGLRLGEGSGAALALPLIKSALALHNNMATFQQAGVSEGK